MAIKEKLIITILSSLNNACPNDVEKMEDIIPAHQDQEDVCLHLFHLRESGFVKFIDLSSKNGKACTKIKITPPGIDYLKSIS